MIPWLAANNTRFPPVERALDDPNGLLAAGGDLSPDRLVAAYRQGIFPWFNPGEPILWWSPDPRCVLFPADLYLSRSLRKRLRRRDYQVTFDQAFDEVIQACADIRSEKGGTWISEPMQIAYNKLHGRGVAHSVEVWIDGELAGGLYGLAMGRMFFGESMFSRQRDASKIAFSHLAVQLQRWGFNLIDCQVYNPHLASLGATVIPRKAFSRLLHENTDQPEQTRWQFDIDADAVTGDNND
ncbi:leucyl/phenylalanyl-tRNA--protein transferase [Nitrincola alkalilacustris]|uniref:leucyl/phenylalanyl-tRNA--protein transferase n=1 Tax=Nitrincola alkalilacustris TaxID=1571224 RepID=UPI00124EA888|nr:leucyl/phenylalanyl-tRNA--protein transferase [Nitrincola alkalilacustris]